MTVIWNESNWEEGAYDNDYSPSYYEVTCDTCGSQLVDYQKTIDEVKEELKSMKAITRAKVRPRSYEDFVHFCNSDCLLEFERKKYVTRKI